MQSRPAVPTLACTYAALQSSQVLGVRAAGVLVSTLLTAISFPMAGWDLQIGSEVIREIALVTQRLRSPSGCATAE